MTLKLHPIIIIAMLIGMGIFIFTLFKGCQNSKLLKTKLNASESKLDSIILKQERDSISSMQNAKDYKDSLQFANGIIDLNQNKLEATQEKLLASMHDAAAWKLKYENVQPNTDTSATMVPNDFISDCHDCFDDLEHKNRVIKLYVQEVKDVDSAHRSKAKIQENRIDQLVSEKNTFQQNFHKAIDLVEDYQKSLKPRGKLYFTLSAIAVQSILPNGVGAGLKYKDRRDRIYGAKVFGSEVGRIYEAETSLPLSFRRKPKL